MTKYDYKKTCIEDRVGGYGVGRRTPTQEDLKLLLEKIWNNQDNLNQKDFSVLAKLGNK